MDFGCGTGRSTKFLRRLGFDTVGVDVAESMLKKAREIDPEGDYHLVEEGDLGHFRDGAYDLVLSTFTFDNIPTAEKKVASFREIGRLLKSKGRTVNLVSSPEMYTHEWASFSTGTFPRTDTRRAETE
jgi:ubiquinone/menaquinone biosynthesis C-methylase UbiE